MDYSTIEPQKVVRVKETWRKPRGNIGRTIASFYSFAILGMHGPALGALMPQIGTFYDLPLSVLSLLFLPTFFGFLGAAGLTEPIHYHLGRRGIAFIGPISQIISYLLICTHPPFPMVVISLVLGGCGVGLQNASWSAYIGDLHNATQTLGLLHGIFGLGAVAGPVIASLIVEHGLGWYKYYDLMLVLSILNFFISVPAFWTSTGKRYRFGRPPKGQPYPTTPGITRHDIPGPNGRRPSSTPSDSSSKQTLYNTLFGDATTARIMLFNTLYVVLYVGIEGAISGWMAVYMLRQRHADILSAALVISGFFVGIASGRIILAFVTPRIGERRAIGIYCTIALILEIIFALIPAPVPEAANSSFNPNILVTAVVVLQGFFLGPLFPAGIVVLTSVLPKHAHVQAIALLCASGAIGATAIPTAIGAMAGTWGIGVLVPVLSVSLAAMLGTWIVLARVMASADEERRERGIVGTRTWDDDESIAPGGECEPLLGSP